MKKRIRNGLRQIANRLPDVFEVVNTTKHVPWEKVPDEVKDIYRERHSIPNNAKPEDVGIVRLWPVKYMGQKKLVNHEKQVRKHYARGGVKSVQHYADQVAKKHKLQVAKYPNLFIKKETANA